MLKDLGGPAFREQMKKLADSLSGSKMLPIPLILYRLSNLIGDEVEGGHPRLRLAIHNLLSPDKAFLLPDSKDIFDRIYDGNYVHTRRPLQRRFTRQAMGAWTHYYNNITNPATQTNRRILARTMAMQNRLDCFGWAAEFAKEHNYDHREVEIGSRAFQTYNVRYVLTIFLGDEKQLRYLQDDYHIWKVVWIPYNASCRRYNCIHEGWNLCMVGERGLRLDDFTQAPWDETEHGIPHIIEYLREKKVRFKVWPIIDYQKDMPEAKITTADVIDALDTVEAGEWFRLFSLSFGEAAKAAFALSKQQIPIDQIYSTYYFDLDRVDLPKVGGPIDRLLSPINISVFKEAMKWLLIMFMAAWIGATTFHRLHKIEDRHIEAIFKRWGVGSMDNVALSPRKRIMIMNFPAGKFETRLGFGPAKLLRLLQHTAHQRRPAKKGELGADLKVNDFINSESVKACFLGPKFYQYECETMVVHFASKWRSGLNALDIFGLIMASSPEFGYLQFSAEKYTVKSLWKALKAQKKGSGTILVIRVGNKSQPQLEQGVQP
jgi:hypothetical protein